MAIWRRETAVALFVLIFLGIVLAISLPIAGKWGRRVVAAILVALSIIAALVVFWIYNLYSTEQLVEAYTDNLASAFGVSPLLSKAAAFALLLPAGMALAWAFSSDDKVKRRWGRAILAGAAVFYFLALWVATKDQKGTWSETPAWFRTKLFVASDASIALSFSDVSDAHQFFTSPLRSSNNLDYRANPPHGRNTDIGCR